jgi:hypothetical protein
VVSIYMSPTESAFGVADLMLSAGPDFEEQVTALNKGDEVEFEAVIKSRAANAATTNSIFGTSSWSVHLWGGLCVTPLRFG